MLVQVTEVQYDGGTVAIGVGVNAATGEPVRFGGDWRPMQQLAEAVNDQGEVVAEVEDWQVLGG